MLSKGISRTHSLFRPHLPHALDSYGLRYLALKAASSPPVSESELSLETASLNAITASKKKKPVSKKKKLDSVVNTLLTTNSVVPDASVQIPVYSYRHCIPLPTVVYIEQEEEANELITRLKSGYVFQIKNISRLFMILTNVIPSSPIAFDMEWYFCIRRQKNAAKATLINRPTAVVQVADSNGLILVIQVYNMNRTLFACHSSVHLKSIMLVARVSD